VSSKYWEIYADLYLYFRMMTVIELRKLRRQTPWLFLV